MAHAEEVSDGGYAAESGAIGDGESRMAEEIHFPTMRWSCDGVCRQFSPDRYIPPVTSIRRDITGFRFRRHWV